MTALELSRASARTDALFRAHHDEVYRSLLRDLGSPADAEDGTQAVFLSAFRSLQRGCAPWSARAWLLAIAKNVARRAWRERARAAEGFEPDDVPAAEAPDEARRELFDALEALPAPQSRALLLHELCGMRYDETRRSRSRPWQVSRRRSSAPVVRFDPPSSTMERSAHEGAAKLLERFVAGKLTRQERQALQAHLVRCEECAALEVSTPGSTAAAPPARLAPLDPGRPPTCGGDAPVVPRPRPRRGRALRRRARGRRERWAGPRSTGAPTGDRCLDERCVRPAGTRRRPRPLRQRRRCRLERRRPRRSPGGRTPGCGTGPDPERPARPGPGGTRPPAPARRGTTDPAVGRPDG